MWRAFFPRLHLLKSILPTIYKGFKVAVSDVFAAGKDSYRDEVSRWNMKRMWEYFKRTDRGTVPQWGSFVAATLGIWLVLTQLTKIDESVKNNSVATIYSHSLRVSEIALKNPKLRDYFYADDRADDGDRFWWANKLNSESPDDRKLILNYCELVADFIEHSSNYRHTLNKNDWNTW